VSDREDDVCRGTQASGVEAYGPAHCRGKCSCGWRGPQRVWEKDAYRDVVRHLGFDLAPREENQ